MLLSVLCLLVTVLCLLLTALSAVECVVFADDCIVCCWQRCFRCWLCCDWCWLCCDFSLTVYLLLAVLCLLLFWFCCWMYCFCCWLRCVCCWLCFSVVVCAVSRSVGQLLTCDFVVPHRGFCHYWLPLVPSQSGTLELKQNVYCVKSSVSGLLSAAVIFRIQEIPSLKSPKWELAAGVVLCTCMYCSMYRFPACTGKRLHTLPSDPVMGDKAWEGFIWVTLTNNIHINFCD